MSDTNTAADVATQRISISCVRCQWYSSLPADKVSCWGDVDEVQVIELSAHVSGLKLSGHFSSSHAFVLVPVALPRPLATAVSHRRVCKPSAANDV